MKYEEGTEMEDIMPAATGVFGGSVCVKKGAKDDDILAIVNKERGPSGTSAGWCITKFKRKKRVQCPDYPDREHAAYTC